MENPKNKKFTPEEDDIIRQHYPTGGVPECLKYLNNRYEASISGRASRLGIKYIGLTLGTGGIKKHHNSKMVSNKPGVSMYRERLNSYLGTKIGKPNYHPARDVGDYKQEKK